MYCENFCPLIEEKKFHFSCVLFFLPQSALRQVVQTLQEENMSLKNAVDRAPTAEKLSKLEKQIGKPLVCAFTPQ